MLCKKCKKIFFTNVGDLLCKNCRLIPIPMPIPIPIPKITIMCDICKNSFSSEDILTLNCEHKFCKNCWKKDAIEKIQSEVDLNCFICSKEVDFHILESNLPKEFAQKYDQYLLNKLIQNEKIQQNHKENQFENMYHKEMPKNQPLIYQNPNQEKNNHKYNRIPNPNNFLGK